MLHAFFYAKQWTLTELHVCFVVIGCCGHFTLCQYVTRARKMETKNHVNTILYQLWQCCINRLYISKCLNLIIDDQNYNFCVQSLLCFIFDVQLQPNTSTALPLLLFVYKNMLMNTDKSMFKGGKGEYISPKRDFVFSLLKNTQDLHKNV